MANKNFEELCGAKKKPEPDPRDFKFTRLSAYRNTNLPKSCSIKDKFGKVYDQPYSNCTSNAALGCDAYYYHKPNGSWVPSTVFTYYNQLVWPDGSSKDIEDDGSTVECALKMVRKYGACNSKVWSNEQPFNKKPSKEAYADGLHGHELTKFYAVKTQLQVKKALNSGYPVVGSFAWVKFNYDENYVLDDCTKKQAEDCDCGHAVVIVGYDDDKELYEFRNSWGGQWGNKGYAYMTYHNFKLCAWWDDMYAIVK